ncbi:MAG TPA: glutamate synthase subunit beta [Spirochaetota bacterium]|nr:glutamate synthase subunit beta [Spirochaetota bacterium]
MGDPKGFLKYRREEAGYRPVEERIRDYGEVEKMLPDEARRAQAGRCMDCGVPFCHWGCPISNIMPEWQDKIFRGDWNGAYDLLRETSSFPEFTGRVCPAPCEAACVLAFNDDPVTIRQNELAVIEKAFELGLVKPEPPATRSDKRVAVIGSGPAGLACADRLNRAGHRVVLFEAEQHVGGYLRYGIPDFKLDKRIVDRRADLMVQEGVEIRTGIYAGRDISGEDLIRDFDAVCIAIGAREPRDLDIEGRENHGIYFAMEYLAQQNKIVSGEHIDENSLISALNKDVLVIGGGDTGSDCVGTANRQGARSITQLELLPQPPLHRPEHEPWPLWPKVLKTSSSHEEGCVRMWNILTRKFTGENGNVTGAEAVQVAWTPGDNGKMNMAEVPGTGFSIKADLVLLAMGFSHPVHTGIVTAFGLEVDTRGNIAVDSAMMTSKRGIFAAGDASRGASLVVWAIQEGKDAADGIHKYLTEPE